MKYTMTVSPDFSPKHIAGWYIFNTWLQIQLSQNIHLELYNSFDVQRKAIEQDEIDIIYANPFDAAMLVKDKGFKAIAKPHHKPDEAVIAVASQSDIYKIEDLQAGIHIAKTDDPDVNMIGMIMLEPADLNAENTTSTTVDTYVLVAKQIFQNKADVGFFLRDAYDDLSKFVKEQLRVLVSSQIHVITHTLLISPKAQAHQDDIQQLLVNMPDLPKGQGVLDSIGVKSWEVQTQEDAEFMIDLMDTLMD